ncbi:tRNA (guanine(10)-N2)-methyltransferase [Nymphon striatum]|nr:tRNA (guanine(10)-N2)-methyltransferase [Nymphon striatum]
MAAHITKTNGTLKKYILRFANEHIDFRLPELQSLLSFFNIPVKYDKNFGEEPYVFVETDNEEDIHKLMSRTFLIRSAVEYWASGTSYQQLHENLKKLSPSFVKPFQSIDQSFKVCVEAYGKKLTLKYKVQRIDKLEFMAFDGPIDLNNPDNTFYLLEFYGMNPNEASEQPVMTYFGRLIRHGQRRKIIDFSLKKRKFIGNTSMDAGLSLIMANQAHVKEGSIIIDPFVGTGSLLVAAAEYGAYVMGTDIDYKTLHGLGKPTRSKQKQREIDENIKNNLRQYNLESQYLDVIVADASLPLWKEDFKFDAVITDPPYGIREATERIGTSKNYRLNDEHSKNHIPSKIDYSLGTLVGDLLNFAAKYLHMNGCLVYWLPVYKEDYNEECIPTHPCLKLVANSEQELTEHTSRRLITMEKIKEFSSDKAEVHEMTDSFRKKYFQPIEKEKFNRPKIIKS